MIGSRFCFTILALNWVTILNNNCRPITLPHWIDIDILSNNISYLKTSFPIQERFSGSVPHTLFGFSEILPLLGNPLSSPEKSFSRAVEIPGWGRSSSALCANLLKASGSQQSSPHPQIRQSWEFSRRGMEAIVGEPKPIWIYPLLLVARSNNLKIAFRTNSKIFKKIVF